MVKTKIVITEIDLGISIDDIISADVAELTGQAEKELDTALAVVRATHAVKTERETKAKEADTKLQAVMEAAYDQLVKAGEVGVPVSMVMATVEGPIPNSSAFTLRMKTILVGKGSPYTLERKKVHGTPHYILMPYNLQQPTTP